MKRHIDFGEYVKTLCASLPEVAQNPGIDLTCATEPVTLGLDKVSTLGMVVAELVTNSYETVFQMGGRVQSSLRCLVWTPMARQR